MNEQALNKKTSVLRKSGAVLLVAWGGLHAYGAVVLSHDAAQQPLIPNLFLPRWPFYDVIIFSALLAATGGIALWLDRRWGWGVSSVGVLGLWGAPLYFEVHHFGWSEIDALTYLVKLAAAVVILIPPIASRLRRRSQSSEVSYSPSPGWSRLACLPLSSWSSSSCV